jgi:hypothetical protein
MSTKTSKKVAKKAKKVNGVTYRDGAINQIADVTGYSPSHVSNVLAGRRNNANISKVAKKYVKRVR